MNDTRPRCYVCGELDGPEDRELRPYGEGGRPICFGCMTSDPAHEAEAQRQMAAVLAKLPRQVGVIDGKGPPRPLTRVERRALRRAALPKPTDAERANVIPIERARKGSK